MVDNTVHVACTGCGNVCDLTILKSFTEKIEDPYIDGYTLEYNTSWQILRCPTCNEMLLNKHTYQLRLDEDETSSNEIINNKILYPCNNINFNHVPKAILELYGSLINSIYSDSKMALMKMRKILDMICEEKKSKNTDLRTKLLDLYQKGIISKKILKLCNIIREIGNNITHETNCINIEQVDLYKLKRIIEVILFYTYELDNMVNYFFKEHKINHLNIKNNKEQSLFNKWKENCENFNISHFQPYWLLEVTDDFINKLISNKTIKNQIKEKIKNYFKNSKRINSRLVNIYYKYFET